MSTLGIHALIYTSGCLCLWTKNFPAQKTKKLRQHQQQRTSSVIMSLANSLDNVTNEIRGCLAGNAAMVFWQHHEETFRYLTTEDNTRFKGELVNLRTQLRKGIINSVSAGPHLVIDGKNLAYNGSEICHCKMHSIHASARRRKFRTHGHNTIFFHRQEVQGQSSKIH